MSLHQISFKKTTYDTFLNFLYPQQPLEYELELSGSNYRNKYTITTLKDGATCVTICKNGKENSLTLSKDKAKGIFEILKQNERRENEIKMKRAEIKNLEKENIQRFTTSLENLFPKKSTFSFLRLLQN